MRSRWTILSALFVVRAAMAFQFQSVATVAPELSQGLGLSLADIGILIGLYFAPGAALALPGGAIGRRYGDKATVLSGLLMMLAGELLMTASTSWNVQIAGRLIAGTGGVLLNVLLTKMVTDWFAGREIATAMAILVNSWPAGIAVSLMLLPAVGAAFGLAAVALTVTALIAIGTALVAFLYRSPETPVIAPGSGHLTPRAVSAVIVSGLVWSLYNIGFAMIFSFGPSLLVERGWSSAAAGSTISIVLWLAALSVPCGGYLADRTRRGDAILVVGCIAFSVLLVLLPRNDAVLPVIVALGLACGLPAGAIMSLPARVLERKTRAIGMGIFYTAYYAGMLVGPAVGGRLSTWAGSAGAALDFGAAVLLACPLGLWLLRRIPRDILPPAALSS
jgi:MFS family permease